MEHGIRDESGATGFEWASKSRAGFQVCTARVQKWSKSDLWTDMILLWLLPVEHPWFEDTGPADNLARCCE